MIRMHAHPTIKVVPIPIEEKCSFKCGNSIYEAYIIDDITWHKEITEKLQQLKQNAFRSSESSTMMHKGVAWIKIDAVLGAHKGKVIIIDEALKSPTMGKERR